MSDMAKSEEGQVAEGGMSEFDKAVDGFILASEQPSPADAGETDQNPDMPGQIVEQPGSEPEARDSDPVGGEAPPAETQSTDIWANAPAELKAAHEAALSAATTKQARIIGQLSAADRELARLRAESQQRAAPDTQTENTSDDEIARLREEYGEIANPLLNQIESLRAELSSLKGPVLEMGNAQQIQMRNEQVEFFTAAHPDWQAYTNDSRYPEWLATQPKAVQDAAARAVSIEDGQEAAWLLGQFKQAIGVTATPAPAEPAPTPKPPADQRRMRQLGAGRDGGAGSPPVQTGIPNDFDAATDAFIAKAEREAARKSSGSFR